MDLEFRIRKSKWQVNSFKTLAEGLRLLKNYKFRSLSWFANKCQGKICKFPLWLNHSSYNYCLVLTILPSFLVLRSSYNANEWFFVKFFSSKCLLRFRCEGFVWCWFTCSITCYIDLHISFCCLCCCNNCILQDLFRFHCQMFSLMLVYLLNKCYINLFSFFLLLRLLQLLYTAC